MPCPGDPGPRPDWIPALNAARLVMRYSVFGQNVENVHTFQRDGNWDYSALFALATEALASWHTNIKPLLPAVATLVDVVATDLENEDGVQATVAASAPGTSASAAFNTLGNTFAIKFATGLTGRSHRGRMYWPVLIDSVVNDGALTNAAAALAYVDAIGDFMADINSATDASHCIVSYQNDCEWRDVAEVNNVNAYTYTDLFLDSQRRRLLGRGT
jgi:hypothetical protein